MSVALGLYAEFVNEIARDQFYNRFPVSKFPLLSGETIDWELEEYLQPNGKFSSSSQSIVSPDNSGNLLTGNRL
ncbi:MAG: hypothetical protein AAF485_10150 [Chloroflexota bacterium]